MKGRDIEREYTRVKKSLEVLGYRDPLGLDSVSIVNKVLNDLIKTTEGFKKLQDERDKLRNELKSQGDLILPLRNENMRLTKENNELHKEMINLKDNLDKNNNTNMQNYTRNENEKEEFKLILNQKDNLIKSQQAEIDSLKQKMNDLFDKVYFEPQNGINNIMNKTNSTDMYTRPRVVTKGGFEISSPLIAPEEGVGVDSQSPNINVDIFKKELDNYNLNKESWAKDLKLAGDEAEKLRNEIRSLRTQLSEKENNIETLRNKISSRDNEINSLQMKNYIGDDNKEELKIKYNAE
jgi:centrosomal protein CEP135